MFQLGPSATYRKCYVSDTGVFTKEVTGQLTEEHAEMLMHFHLIQFQECQAPDIGYILIAQGNVLIEDRLAFSSFARHYLEKLKRCGYAIYDIDFITDALLAGYIVGLYVTRHLVLREFIHLVPVDTEFALFPDWAYGIRHGYYSVSS